MANFPKTIGIAQAQPGAEQSATPAPEHLRPLKALIFSHRDVFGAAISCLSDVSSSSFDREFIDIDGESHFYSFNSAGCLIADPGDDPIFWDATPVELDERRRNTWEVFPSTWEEALRKFSILVRAGSIILWGRWGTMRAPLERIPADAWPERSLSALERGDIHFQSGTLETLSGETVFSIQFERRQTIEPEKTNADLMAEWILEAWPAYLNGDALKGRLAEAGRTQTNFNLEKREAREILAQKRPDIAARYGRNDPQK